MYGAKIAMLQRANEASALREKGWAWKFIPGEQSSAA